MALTDEHAEYRRELVDAGLFIPLGADGLYGRGSAFEVVVDGVTGLIDRGAAPLEPTRLRFPPVFTHEAFEDTDYIASFPNLTGAVFSFTGGDAEHARLLADRSAGEDWTGHLVPSGKFLASAACHPLYQVLRGTQLEASGHFDVYGYCFRHEPSIDPFRMQAFRMKETVFLGTPGEALAFRDSQVERFRATLTELGLDVQVVPANDPFFGRAGRMLSVNQRDQELKLELVVRMYPSSDEGTAITSGNYHQDHFGLPFGITTADGQVAHGACMGFGVDRIALALLRTHGLDPAAWPQPVRDRLWP